MKSDKKVLKGIAMVSQIGISMLVPIVLCTYVGERLDNWCLTSHYTIILAVLGIVVAYRNVYHLTKTFYTKEKEKEDALLMYFKSGSRETGGIPVSCTMEEKGKKEDNSKKTKERQCEHTNTNQKCNTKDENIAGNITLSNQNNMLDSSGDYAEAEFIKWKQGKNKK